MLLLAWAAPALAQNQLERVNQARQERALSGTRIFLGLNGLNLGLSSALYFSTEPDWQPVYGLNMAWAATNLVLGSMAYYSLRRQATQLDPWGSIKEHYQLEKAYLFNTALDLSYITVGVAIAARAASQAAYQAQIQRGYGASFMLQGGLLLVYDLVMYLRIHGQADDLGRVLDEFYLTPQGLGYRWRL